MATTFKEIRKLQGERVRMQFDDGREVVAVLLCATKDMDGSKHLIYDRVEPDKVEPEKVESGSVEAAGSSAGGCCYADARTLVRIEHADASKAASALRKRSPLAVRNEVAKAAAGSWRPSA
jgi:hypothetical protein